MDLELSGRTALVVGGSTGIGAATAQALAEEGCDVAVTYRSTRDGAEEAAWAVRREGRRSWVAELDLRDLAAVAPRARSLAEEVGGLDVVVLCAGRNVVTPLGEISPQEWGSVLDVNLGGAFFALQALAPHVRPGGSIVTVASVAAHTGAPHHAHYAAAKAGLVNLTKSLARELAPDVRVNCVAPGITLTEMGRQAIESLAPDYAEKNLWLQRYASSRRIAQVVAFVASPVTEFMTGATVDVNSGRFAR
jgi:NAD(P)-dependent dehydrogenase (short-subunit alcohol dehydrogenase family)